MKTFFLLAYKSIRCPYANICLFSRFSYKSW